MDPHATHRSQAFTLVELLVVMAIVAVLMGILLPVLGSAHESGNIAKCTSNMHQVFSALILYTSDHADTLPQRFYGDDSKGQPLGYTELILVYVDPGSSAQYSLVAKKVYTCPSQRNPSYSAEPGYGMNWFYDNADLAHVARPSQTILLAETLGTGGTGSRRADRDNNSGDVGMLDATRHRGQSNYVFFDGHLSRLAYADTRKLSSASSDGTPTDLWGTDFGDHSEPAPTTP